jgi:hypothetical protein
MALVKKMLYGALLYLMPKLWYFTISNYILLKALAKQAMITQRRYRGELTSQHFLYISAQ